MEIKNANPHSEIIEQNSRLYYANIRENLDKIREMYEGDPQTRSQTVKEYLKHVGASIKVAKEKANNRVLKGKRAKSASQKIRKAHEAINNFKVNGTELSAIPTPTRRTASPFSGNRQDILRAVSGSLGR
jgi:2-oxoglutarate dehydrogenase complex dehydrogenase (E1) component-like enzyme